jgi:hypothetical protein
VSREGRPTELLETTPSPAVAAEGWGLRLMVGMARIHVAAEHQTDPLAAASIVQE